MTEGSPTPHRHVRAGTGHGQRWTAVVHRLAGGDGRRRASSAVIVGRESVCTRQQPARFRGADQPLRSPTPRVLAAFGKDLRSDRVPNSASPPRGLVGRASPSTYREAWYVPVEVESCRGGHGAVLAGSAATAVSALGDRGGRGRGGTADRPDANRAVLFSALARACRPIRRRPVRRRVASPGFSAQATRR